MLAQVLNDPDAAAWVRWLNFGYWLLLATCVLAVIAGGATIATTSNTDHGRWGRHMVAAGLAGALALAILAPFINWCYDLIVAP
jgi:hypothetical protein